MPLECLFVYPQSLKLHCACVLRYTVYLKLIFLSHYCESSHKSGGSDTETILWSFLPANTQIHSHLWMGDLPDCQFPKTITFWGFLNARVSLSLGEADKTGRGILIKARSEIIPSLWICSFAARQCWVPSTFHSLLLSRGPLMVNWSKPNAYHQNSPEFQHLHPILNPSSDLKKIKEVCPCAKISLDG